MSAGIYKIINEKTRSVYIGHSIDVENKLKQYQKEFKYSPSTDRDLLNLSSDFSEIQNLNFEIVSIAPDIDNTIKLKKFLEIEENLEIKFHKNNGWNVINKLNLHFEEFWNHESEITNSIIYFVLKNIDRFHIRNSQVDSITGLINNKNLFLSDEHNDLSSDADAIISLAIGALNDNPEATLQLGSLYKRGIFVKKNIRRAIDLFGQAANYTETRKDAYSDLGEIFNEKIPFLHNQYRSLSYSVQAVAEGDVFSAYRIGTIYADDAFEGNDIAKAIYWYEYAFEKGCEFSALELGLLYLRGHQIEKDYEKARVWLERAAITSFDGTAEYELAFIYLDELGVPSDYEKAANYVEKAILRGSKNAIFTMGWLYEHGEGVRKDLVIAYAWYLISESDESEINLLREKLSETQIEYAKEKSQHLISELENNYEIIFKDDLI